MAGERGKGNKRVEKKTEGKRKIEEGGDGEEERGEEEGRVWRKERGRAENRTRREKGNSRREEKGRRKRMLARHLTPSGTVTPMIRWRHEDWLEPD